MTIKMILLSSMAAVRIRATTTKLCNKYKVVVKCKRSQKGGASFYSAIHKAAGLTVHGGSMILPGTIPENLFKP